MRTTLRRGLAVGLVLSTACHTLISIDGDGPPPADDPGPASPSTPVDGTGDQDSSAVLDAARPESTPDVRWARVAFVTGAAHGGDLGGLPGADAICNAEAARSGLPGVFLAYLHRGDGDVGHPGHRLPLDGGWGRADGLAVFDGNPRDVPPLIPLDRTPDAARIAATERVWTGISGAPSGLCGTGSGDSWTTASTALGGAGWGDPSATSSAWAQHGSLVACNERLHIYCFEQ